MTDDQKTIWADLLQELHNFNGMKRHALPHATTELYIHYELETLETSPEDDCETKNYRCGSSCNGTTDAR